MDTIDWKKIAAELNAQDTGSTYLACEAIELIIGHDNIKNTVDYYVTSFPEEGTELARSFLWHIHSKVAMHRCYEIYSKAEDHEIRSNAVELLRVVADSYKMPEILEWIPEFLKDSDERVQNWGIGIIDQLTFSKLVDDEKAESLLNEYKHHESEFVREKSNEILKYIGRRKNYE